jgi:hypothetical protein
VDGILRAAPLGLREALESHGAAVERAWAEGPRAYIVLDSSGGPLFARYSTAPEDRAALRHEAEVRALVGESGPLRSPKVHAQGEAWLLERRIVPGEEPVELVVAAAAELASCSIPTLAASGRGGSHLDRLARRLRLLSRPQLARKVLEAHRLIAGSTLPEVTTHGDFHPGNVLLADGAAWVVDWELAGRGPAGLDLMRYWATLGSASKRDRLYAAAVELVGDEPALALLRYAITVVTAADKLSHPSGLNRDPEGAKALLDLLPGLRSAAGL